MGEWIAWEGGEPPIEKGTRHFVRYRDGAETAQNGVSWADRAWRFYWMWAGNDDDIVAYRLPAGEK